MSLIVGIDGSDGELLAITDGRNRTYDNDFKNSFVSKICKPEVNGKKYFRGPITDGTGLGSAIDHGERHIISLRNGGNREPILLTGYSRGGLGVIVIANRLRSRNIPVRAMMLFDPVDMHVWYDGAVIPNNVENLCNVMRNPRANSRHSFGNTGTAVPSGSQTRVYRGAVRRFMCTHGGMGGVPWNAQKDGKQPGDYIDEGISEQAYNGRTNITYQQDVENSQSVWNDVVPFLREHGFINF